VPRRRTGYRDGDPIPQGYHLEEQTRSGLVNAGIILTAIPYALGVFAAIGADFENKSSWLAVPWVGPWLVLGQREYVCDDRRESLKCVGETFAIMGIIADGVIQAAGGTLLLIGVVSTKSVLVPDSHAVRFAPMRVGSGYGLGLGGAF